MSAIGYSVNGRALLMDDATTELYGDTGPEGDRVRRAVRADAQIIAEALGKAVEIYASKSAGGYMECQVEPSEEARLAAEARWYAETQKSL